MTHEFLCNEVPRNSRNITETSQVFMGHDPHTKTHSGVRIVLGYPNQDTWEDTGHRIDSLRGNEGRESSGDRGVNHIHHTPVNPHTAIISLLTTDSTNITIITLLYSEDKLE